MDHEKIQANRVLDHLNRLKNEQTEKKGMSLSVAFANSVWQSPPSSRSVDHTLPTPHPERTTQDVALMTRGQFLQQQANFAPMGQVLYSIPSPVQTCDIRRPRTPAIPPPGQRQIPGIEINPLTKQATQLHLNRVP
jgi:hypothetical protein